MWKKFSLTKIIIIFFNIEHFSLLPDSLLPFRCTDHWRFGHAEAFAGNPGALSRHHRFLGRMSKGWKQFFSVNNFWWVLKFQANQSHPPEQPAEWWCCYSLMEIYSMGKIVCVVFVSLSSVAGLLLFIGFLLNVVNLILSYRLFKISETVSLLIFTSSSKYQW